MAHLPLLIRQGCAEVDVFATVEEAILILVTIAEHLFDLGFHGCHVFSIGHFGESFILQPLLLRCHSCLVVGELIVDVRLEAVFDLLREFWKSLHIFFNI